MSYLTKVLLVILSITSGYSQANIPGPKSKKLVAQTDIGVRLSAEQIDRIGRDLSANFAIPNMAGENKQKAIDFIKGHRIVQERLTAEKARRVEEEARAEEQAQRLGSAAKTIQEGVRKHLTYKRQKERWTAAELTRQQIIMAATGVFSTDRDDIWLGSLRTAARQILDSLESYMDLIGVPSCRRAQKYMQEGGVIEPDVMPRHIEVYREILERVVPDDRPWVRPKDLVMEMDEPTIRRTLEDVNTLLEKNSRVSRGVRHTAHIDPETNLADALPRG